MKKILILSIALALMASANIAHKIYLTIILISKITMGFLNLLWKNLKFFF